MAVKDEKTATAAYFLAFFLYHLLLASLSSNNPKQPCSRSGSVSEETELQSAVLFWGSLQTSLVKNRIPKIMHGNFKNSTHKNQRASQSLWKHSIYSINNILYIYHVRFKDMSALKSLTVQSTAPCFIEMSA